VLVARWFGRTVFRIGRTGRHAAGANATGP
jgi:hypothetical protein